MLRLRFGLPCGAPVALAMWRCGPGTSTKRFLRGVNRCAPERFLYSNNVLLLPCRKPASADRATLLQPTSASGMGKYYSSPLRTSTSGNLHSFHKTSVSLSTLPPLFPPVELLQTPNPAQLAQMARCKFCKRWLVGFCLGCIEFVSGSSAAF